MDRLYTEGKIILPQILAIPEISDKRLKEIYKRLRPIITIDEVKYIIREYTLKELRNCTFTWFPKQIKEEAVGIVDPNSIKPVEDFLCLHRDYNLDWRAHSVFKPVISEVLSQAPNKTLRYANYFEVIEYPTTNKDKVKFEEVYQKNLLLSKVRSYKTIKEQH